MANVLTIKRKVVDVTGAALSGKTATLKREDTGATVTTTTTDANGYFEFANQDESLSYRVEVAAGGSSTQKFVTSPASAEFLHAYIRNSLRTNSGATVAIGGAMSVAGTLTVSTGGITVTGNSTITGTLNATTSLTTPALNVGSGLLVASIGQVSSTGSLVIDGNIQGQAAIQAGTGLIVVAGGITATGQTALTGSTAGSDSLTVTGPASHSAKLLNLKNSGAALQFAVGFSGEIWSNQIQAVAVPATNSHRMPIYNNAGTLMGYIPIYS